MRDDAFERRVQMIQAGEKGDFAAVNDLLKNDTQLESFGVYLQSMMRFDKSFIEKSLALPALDRNNRYFDNMMRDTIATAAMRGNTEVAELLLAQSKNPAQDATIALKFLFNNLSNYRSMDKAPSTEIGQLLIKNGGKLDEALILPEGQLSAREEELRVLKGQVNDFKSRLQQPKP